MHRRPTAWLLASLALVGCKPREPREGAPAPTPAPVEDTDDAAKRVSPGPLRVPKAEPPIFTYAELASTTAEVPARYAAPLPADVATAQGDWADATPPQIVAVRICRADDGMRERVVTALDAAADHGATGSQLSIAYGRWLRIGCPAPGYCAWARGLTESGRTPAVREFAWYLLEGCRDDATREHFASHDLPLGPMLIWMTAAAPSDRDERFVAGLRHLMRTTTDDEPSPILLNGLEALALADDDAKVRAATKLYTETKHPRVRAHLIRTLARNPSAVAQSFFAKRCNDLDPPDCEPDLDGRAPDDLVALWREQPQSRAEIETALRDCASGSQDDAVVDAEECLMDLARVLRPAAVDVATELLRDPDYEQPQGIATILQRFPSQGALEDHLDALGLAARPGSTPDLEAVGLFDILRSRGRAGTLDPEDTEFPHGHDVLLHDLAALMAPDLDGVVFEQRAPQQVDGAKLDPDEPYTLVAYMDGQRYEAPAQDMGDWIDLGSVLGLLNALARTRGREARIVSSPSIDGLAQVIAGPHAALEALADAELLRVEGQPSASDD